MSDWKSLHGGTPAADRTPDGDRTPQAVPETPWAAPETQPQKKPFHFWRLVATVSSLGWSLALPLVAGAIVGNYLDRVTGREYIWTVGLLFAGVALSLYNLYHILTRETFE